MNTLGHFVDRRSLTFRVGVLQVLVVLAFSILGISFWYFQIVQHAVFQEMAENNHQRTLALRAPRGVLFDRNGKVLVENTNTFNITLDREQTKNLDQTLRTLAAATGGSEAQLRETVEGEWRRRPHTYTKGWALLHSVQHTAYHLGQIQMFRKMAAG